jgi:phosphoribosylformimino-5-aminoimidazole carboxamide ribotide isomerase
MQIIPALDLLGTDAVRLEQGDYERVLFRLPIDDVLGRIVAEEPELLHIVDLEGARRGALRTDLIARCRALSGDVALQVSGGIRSVEQARAVLAAGASRVIVGTAAWENPHALGEFADALGSALLIALDVRDGVIQQRGWLASTGLTVESALAQCRDAGIERLHVTAIDRDGTMRGPDLALYEQARASGMAVVAAGGVRDDRDVDALEAVGCEAAVMGLGYLLRVGYDPSELGIGTN